MVAYPNFCTLSSSGFVNVEMVLPAAQRVCDHMKSSHYFTKKKQIKWPCVL